MSFNPNDNTPSVDHRNKPLIGIVINNRDPLQLRRVQVKIEGLLEGSDETNTAWFRPEPSGIGSRTDYGSFDPVPEIHSTVQIMLIDGDLRNGTYRACPDTTVDSSQSRLFGEDYPNTSGTCDASGSFTRTNKKRGYTEQMHSSGFYHQVDNQGNLHIYVPGNIFVHVKGGMIMQVDKDAFIQCLAALGLRGEKDAGISAGGNLELRAANNVGIESETGSNIDLNGGTSYGVKDAIKATVGSAISDKVDSRQKEVRELQEAVKLSGEVAKDSLEAQSDSLLGTRS